MRHVKADGVVLVAARMVGRGGAARSVRAVVAGPVVPAVEVDLGRSVSGR
jgi:hypothetical protein